MWCIVPIFFSAVVPIYFIEKYYHSCFVRDFLNSRYISADRDYSNSQYDKFYKDRRAAIISSSIYLAVSFLCTVYIDGAYFCIVVSIITLFVYIFFTEDHGKLTYENVINYYNANDYYFKKEEMYEAMSRSDFCPEMEMNFFWTYIASTSDYKRWKRDNESE